MLGELDILNLSWMTFKGSLKGCMARNQLILISKRMKMRDKKIMKKLIPYKYQVILQTMELTMIVIITALIMTP